MMEFTQQNETARRVALHYAERLDNVLAKSVLTGDRTIDILSDAVEFTNFFWTMTDLAVEDHENDIKVIGGVNLEFWMEKLMNIFIGYLKESGFYRAWVDESNRLNS